MFKKKMK